MMKFELHAIATTNDELAVKLFDIINKKAVKCYRIECNNASFASHQCYIVVYNLPFDVMFLTVTIKS